MIILSKSFPWQLLAHRKFSGSASGRLKSDRSRLANFHRVRPRNVETRGWKRRIRNVPLELVPTSILALTYKQKYGTDYRTLLGGLRSVFGQGNDAYINEKSLTTSLSLDIPACIKDTVAVATCYPLRQRLHKSDLEFVNIKFLIFHIKEP